MATAVESAVSTTTGNQYLCPEPATSTAEADKSPLAMLTATCNSIGLPDSQGKTRPDKTSPRDTKNDRKENRPGSNNTNGLAALNGRCAFPGLPFGGLMPGYIPGMVPNHFGANPYAAAAFAAFMPPRPPALCTDPLCKGCPSASGLPMPPPPPTDLTTMLMASSYQSLFGGAPPAFSSAPLYPPPPAALAALAAASSAEPSTSTASSTTTVATTASDSSKHICSWMMPGDGACSKKFDTTEQLLEHLKTHASSAPDKGPKPATASPAGGKSSPASRSSSSASRFHPYAPPKLPLPAGLPAMPPLPGMTPLTLPMSSSAAMAAYTQMLSAMFAQPK